MKKDKIIAYTVVALFMLLILSLMFIDAFMSEENWFVYYAFIVALSIIVFLSLCIGSVYEKNILGFIFLILFGGVLFYFYFGNFFKDLREGVYEETGACTLDSVLMRSKGTNRYYYYIQMVDDSDTNFSIPRKTYDLLGGGQSDENQACNKEVKIRGLKHTQQHFSIELVSNDSN